ncbi:DinB family protein [Spirosoma sp. KUDC1026]|uniref:DinB family protein n=1 Tax=Spirosoma sp. KUDC1026 TaxID=2745947 RepID=UPI00159BB41E|nr:DinB family protein [Spirosoma sp. KUDC1026]QKZ11407.1 DinB family protein [Spirosoma sp. KUDC1026]
MSIIIPLLQKEFDQEAITTRKMLERIPDDKYDWQPHPKSMTIRQLATHIADLPSWTHLALTTDGLDFAVTPYSPPAIDSTATLLTFLDESQTKGRGALAEATDDELLPTWTLRYGDQILSVSSTGEMIRMSFSQVVHHRAQLGVYLRLLDIPIPGSYGPSADEQSF